MTDFALGSGQWFIQAHSRWTTPCVAEKLPVISAIWNTAGTTATPTNFKRCQRRVVRPRYTTNHHPNSNERNTNANRWKIGIAA